MHGRTSNKKILCRKDLLYSVIFHGENFQISVDSLKDDGKKKEMKPRNPILPLGIENKKQ